MTSITPYQPITGTCPHCGMIHQTTCPRIKAIEYDPNGMVKRIEFHEPQPAISPVTDWSKPALSTARQNYADQMSGRGNKR